MADIPLYFTDCPYSVLTLRFLKLNQLVKKSVGYSTNDLLETDAVKKLLYNALYDVSGLEPSHWSKISGLSKIFKVRLKNWIAFEQFEVAKFTSRRTLWLEFTC